MTQVLMLDTAQKGTALTLPTATMFAAGYIDGDYVTFPELQQHLPNAVLVPITVLYGGRAKVCDCENGDLTPAQAIAQVVAGWSDTIYCSQSPWESDLLPMAQRAGIRPYWWVAAYPYSTPTTLPPIPQSWLDLNCVAWQYADVGPYDESSALLSWLVPTPPAPPPPKGITIMSVTHNPLTGLRTVEGVDQFDDTILFTETAAEQWTWTNLQAAAGNGAPKLFQVPAFGTAVPPPE